MGWVTLTQRKMELKAQHNDLTCRNLEISRQKRLMAREKTLDTRRIQLAQKAEENRAKLEFNQKKDEYSAKIDELKNLRSILNKFKATDRTELACKDNNGTIVLYGTAVTQKQATNVVDENGNILYIKQVTSNEDDMKDTDISEGEKTQVYKQITINSDNGFGGLKYMPVQPSDIEIAMTPETDGNVTRCVTFKNGIYTMESPKDNNKVYDTATRKNYTYAISMSPEMQALAGKHDITSESLNKINEETNIDSYITSINSDISDCGMELENYQLEYSSDLNAIKQNYEFDLQQLEDESADEELALDTEQMTLETELEHISQEMQSVAQSVSSQIQASTIRLA